MSEPARPLAARPARRRRRRPLLAAAALAAALACTGEETPPAPAPQTPPADTAESAPEAPAAGVESRAPARPPGTQRATTYFPDGRVFEAEYGGEGELPSEFPDDVPLYGEARPMSSVATAEQGTIVNLRTADPPERVFEWYRERFAAEGWETEHEREERGRRLLAVRKGNRVASIVVTSVPEFTQVMLAVDED